MLEFLFFMYFEFSPQWKLVWHGRGRGLIGKGLNSMGLTRRFATPLRFYYYYIFIIDNLVLQNGFSEIITIVK